MSFSQVVCAISVTDCAYKLDQNERDYVKSQLVGLSHYSDGSGIQTETHAIDCLHRALEG